jgi:hypothetical protein
MRSRRRDAKRAIDLGLELAPAGARDASACRSMKRRSRLGRSAVPAELDARAAPRAAVSAGVHAVRRVPGGEPQRR